jgi:hypothetical protein
MSDYMLDNIRSELTRLSLVLFFLFVAVGVGSCNICVGLNGVRDAVREIPAAKQDVNIGK